MCNGPTKTSRRKVPSLKTVSDKNYLNLLAKKVANLHLVLLASDGHVDREVSVHKPHLVLEANGNANDHVVNVTARRTNAGGLLATREPPVNLDCLLVPH